MSNTSIYRFTGLISNTFYSLSNSFCAQLCKKTLVEHVSRGLLLSPFSKIKQIETLSSRKSGPVHARLRGPDGCISRSPETQYRGWDEVSHLSEFDSYRSIAVCLSFVGIILRRWSSRYPGVVYQVDASPVAGHRFPHSKSLEPPDFHDPRGKTSRQAFVPLPTRFSTQ